MLLLLRFFRSSEVTIRVVSTRRESDGSLMRLLCSRKEKVLCFQIKNWKMKTSWFQELFENDLVVCKVGLS